MSAPIYWLNAVAGAEDALPMKTITPEVRKPKKLTENHKKVSASSPVITTAAPVPAVSPLKELMKQSRKTLEERRKDNLPVWRSSST